MKEDDVTLGNTQIQLNEKLHLLSIPISYPEGERVETCYYIAIIL